MIQLRTEDVLHWSTMNKLLIAIADDPVLSHGLIFKGGTCAVMLGWLDRFSIDLDFDKMKEIASRDIRKALDSVCAALSLPVVQKHDRVLLYRVRYSEIPEARKTIKISVNDEHVASSTFVPAYLPDIDRTMMCQTRESMVAHKMVALLDRYTRKRGIAGRDIYDIHHYLVSGYRYAPEVIVERTKREPKQYIQDMISFIKTNVTQKNIDEDLNMLLPIKTFQSVRTVLIPETLSLLRKEVAFCW